MTFQTIRLCAFLLIGYGLFPLTDGQDTVVCKNLRYAGPIKNVIDMRPTKLAEVTAAAAEAAEGFATDMASGAIGGIPYVGMMLSSVFEQWLSVYGAGDLDPVAVYNSLKLEIDQLKLYMDQEIEELKLDQIKKAFGTNGGGIMGYAKHCKNTYKDDPDDMSACLENLRALMEQQYQFFLPKDEKASSYEQTLPLFRMYGQLFVDTVLDQIHVAMKRGKESQAAAHAHALITKVAKFKEHTLDSVKKIILAQVEPHIMPPKNNPSCASSSGVAMCACTIAIGPNKFDAVDRNGFPQDKTKNFCIGVTYRSTDSCKTTMRNYAKKYSREYAEAVATYWRKQVGEIVNQWVKTAETLKPMVENRKRWASADVFTILTVKLSEAYPSRLH